MGVFSRFGHVFDKIDAFGIAHPKSTSAALLGIAGLSVGAAAYTGYRHHQEASAMRKFRTMWANSHGVMTDERGRVRAAY